MKPLLILFTSGYPYGTEESFLENEIPILEKSFNIVIVPAKTFDSIRAVPESIIVDNSFSKLLKSQSKIRKIIYSFLNIFRFLIIKSKLYLS